MLLILIVDALIRVSRPKTPTVSHSFWHRI